MELKISCDATVKLKKITSLKTIDCNVIDYELTKDTLNGNIQIEGTYIKDDMDKTYDFNETVPFTVVFRDANIDIDDIVCANFSCQEIVNQGIECHFDVFITYKGDPKEEQVEEIPVIIEEEIKQVEEIVEETIPVEEIVEEMVPDESAEEEAVSDEDITTEYDTMLGEILEVRNDNFFDESSPRSLESEEKEEAKEAVVLTPEAKKVSVASNDKLEKVGLFSRMKETHDTVRVYFVDSDQEVERICKQEQIPVNEVYQDFAKNKRIIIK